MMEINNNNTNNFNQTRKVEERLSFSIEGNVLYPSHPLEKFSPEELWSELKKMLVEQTGWESLFLEAEERIPREYIEEFAKLNVDIPFSDLKALPKKINLEKLKGLASSEILPIHIAAFFDSPFLLEKALNLGNSLDAICDTEEARNFKGLSPITIAFLSRNINAFEWLLENGADIVTCSKKYLVCKIAYKKREVYAPLFKKYKVLNKIFAEQMREDVYKRSSFHYAAQNDDIDYLQFFLDCGMDINLLSGSGETPFILALAKKNIDAALFLLSQGANPNLGNYVGKSSLYYAIESKNLALIEGILKIGVVENLYYNPLNQAIQIGEKKIIELLAEYGFKPSNQLISNLLSSEGNDGNIAFLLDLKLIDANFKIKQGIPAFHFLLLKDRTYLASLFLEKKELDLEACDPRGINALYMAVARNNLTLTRKLLEKGMDPNKTVSTNISPMHIATLHGSQPMIDLLIEFGANANKEDYNHHTPYHISLWYPSSHSLSQFFLSKGASSDLKPHDAFILFKKNYHPDHKILSKTVLKSDKLYWKEEIKKKRCAHVYNIGGSSPMVLRTEKKDRMETKTVNFSSLEGMNSEIWLERKIIKNLKFLSQLGGKEIAKETIDSLISVLEFSSNCSHTNKDYLERILAKKATMIATGYWSHSVEILFYDDLLIVCNRNRGNGSSSIRVFYFDPKKLSEEIIAKILSEKSKSRAHFVSLISSTLPVSLNLEQEKFEKHFENYGKAKLLMQEYGNCVYTSLEAAIWCFFLLSQTFPECRLSLGKFLEKREEGQKQFEIWSLHNQILSANNYCDFHLNNDSPYYPDIQLIEKIKLFHLERPLSKEHVLYDLLDKLNEKLKNLKLYYPPIRFSGILPSLKQQDQQLKATGGKEPTYYTLFEEYISG